MLRHAIAISFAGAALFARDPGCGGSEVESSSGVNAPCTRDRDCADELRCIHGVCTGPSSDAGRSEGGAKDAADDG